MKIRWNAVAALLLLAAAAARLHAAEPLRRTENVVVIVTDGLRWQEVFRGAEAALFSDKPGGVEDVEALKRAFWRDTPRERREALLPFFWSFVAKEGQIYGNTDEGSAAQVDNGYRFSYPGYNEILTGAADPRIDKNEYGANPNVSVFEWLNAMPEFAGRVGVVAGWDVFPAIFHRERSRLDMRTGWDPPAESRSAAGRRDADPTTDPTTRGKPSAVGNAVRRTALSQTPSSRERRAKHGGTATSPKAP